MTTRILSFQAGYACRNSGACCTSGWPIPVEPEIESRMLEAEDRGRFAAPCGPVAAGLRPAPAGQGSRSLLRQDVHGRCVFFEPSPGRLCSIHRQLGHDALPASCRHFPRVARIGRDRVDLSLSHYCPTAAALLFEDAGPVAIVVDPERFPVNVAYEGLDVSRALPPLLRPGVLTSDASYGRFEAHAVATLTRAGLAPEAALAALASDAGSLARWTPSDGDFEAFCRRVLEHAAHAERVPPGAWHATIEPLWADVVAAVPAALSRPALPEAWEQADAAFVEAAWPSVSGVVGRYLAAKAFASWCAYQGNGLRTTVRAVEAAWAVLRVECARSCQRAGRSLEPALLMEAVRASDLLLVHLAQPLALASRLGAAQEPRSRARFKT